MKWFIEHYGQYFELAYHIGEDLREIVEQVFCIDKKDKVRYDDE